MFILFTRDGRQFLPVGASHHHQADGSVRVEFPDGKVETIAPLCRVADLSAALGHACEIDFLGDSIRVRTACPNCGCVNPRPKSRDELVPVCKDCGHGTEITAEQTQALKDALAPFGFVMTEVNE